MSNFEELSVQVLKWGHEKGILGPEGKGTIKGQVKKFGEESNELIESVGWDMGYADAMAVAGEYQDQTYKKASPWGIVASPFTKDAVGDVLVTVILLCEMYGIKPEECLQLAYDEIAARTGVMKDGVFCRNK